MNHTEAIERGELRKAAGLARAGNRTALVWATQLAFLSALIVAPDQTATLDDAVTDLGETFAAGGKWRGAAVRQLAEQGLIVRAAVELSIRPDRHRGYLTRWRAIDATAIAAKIAELRRLLAALETPEVSQPELY
ncbi:MAG: hypothetical protein FJ303_19455 [Planctomycetes bacterium]|nr:hypothetical protein [Planctomycetota bacterium]